MMALNILHYGAISFYLCRNMDNSVRDSSRGVRREMNCKTTLKAENLVLTTSKKRPHLSQSEDLLVSARCAQVREYGSQQPSPAAFSDQEDKVDRCVLVPARSSTQASQILWPQALPVGPLWQA